MELPLKNPTGPQVDSKPPRSCEVRGAAALAGISPELQGLASGLSGLGFRVQGLGFRVQQLRIEQ